MAAHLSPRTSGFLPSPLRELWRALVLAPLRGALRKEMRRRQAVKAELLDQLAFQRAMLEQIPHAITVRDSGGRMIQCNAAYERLFRKSRADMLGKTVLDSGLGRLDRDGLLKLHRRYLEVLAGRETISEDVDMTVAAGARKLYHWALPIAPQEGRPAVALVTGVIDITERQELIEALDAARLKAEAASRAKSTFLATMSHEIRTPMNAVMGILELLVREGRLSAPDRESAELARGSAESLLGLINDVLDLSKIDAGGLEIVPAPTRLRRLVDEVARVFKGMAHQRGLAIAVEIDPEVGEWHRVDAARFKQIANNLVSNAIKYTDAGGITMRLRHGGRANGIETVVLEVEDTGIGIAAEDQKNLFQPFFQAESAGPRTIGGTGLGLPIVQRLCDGMGAEAEVDSEPGRGTCIRIRFPLEPAPAPGAVPAAEPQPGALPAEAWKGSGVRVLAVDDHPANRLLMQRQLAHLGVAGEFAQDGEEAWALWIGGGFDLVITDCSMPRMDGYALTRAIRAWEQDRGLPRCPVLGCTAHVQEEDRRLALEAGMDECLMKPLSLDELAAAFQRHVEVPAKAAAAADQTADVVADAAAARADAQASPQPPAFDLLALESFSGGGAGIEQRFFEVLLRTNRADMQALEAHAQLREWAEAAAIAHRIKGAARMIDAVRVTGACDAFERACTATDRTAAQRCVDALRAAVDELNAAMTARLGMLPGAATATSVMAPTAAATAASAAVASASRN